MSTNAITALLFAIAFLVVVCVGYFMGLAQVSSAGGAVAVIGALLVFFMLYFLVEKTLEKAEAENRFNKIESKDAVLQAARRGRRTNKRIEEIYQSRRSLIDILATHVQKFFKIEENRLHEARLRLMSAGFYRERALGLYLIISTVAPVVGMILGFLYATWQGESGTGILMYLVLGALGGFMAVRMWLSRRVKGRRQNLAYEMPDAIDLLVIYAESGVAFDGALERIVAQMRRRYPTLTEELHFLEQELQVLPDRVKAYENFGSRADTSIVRAFCAIMSQNERMGAPVVESLKQLAIEARRERLLDAERRAAKIPILIQLPVVMFILPSIMLTVMGPAIVDISRTFGVVVPIMKITGNTQMTAPVGNSQERTFVLSNVGMISSTKGMSTPGTQSPGTTKVGRMEVSGNGYTISRTNCPSMLRSGTCDIVVRFSPSTGGTSEGKLFIGEPTLPNNGISIPLQGIAGG